MALSNEKMRTLVNVLAEEAENIKKVNSRMTELKPLYDEKNINPTGTILDGKVTQIAEWMQLISQLSNHPVTNSLTKFYAHSP